MAKNIFPAPCVEWIPTRQLVALAPPSYHWAHILNATLSGVPALNLPPIEGVIFSGPPGNGKHTTADALAGTLRALQNPFYCLRISACTLDTEDVADACAVIDAVNAALRRHSRICLLVEYPEQSRHSFAIQEYLYQLCQAWKNNLFLILITEDPASISSNLLRKLTLCHCTNPDDKTRQAWFKSALDGNPKHGIPPISLGGINELTLTRETKNFSWKQMTDLRSLMRRELLFKYLRNQATYNPAGIDGYERTVFLEGRVTLAMEELMPLIILVRSQKTPPAVQGPVQVIAGGTAVAAEASPVFKSDSAPAPVGISESTKDVNTMTAAQKLDIDDL